MNWSEKLRDIFTLKKSSVSHISEISSPQSVVKNYHVSYDPLTKTFHGLPPGWEQQVNKYFV